MKRKGLLVGILCIALAAAFVVALNGFGWPAQSPPTTPVPPAEGSTTKTTQAETSPTEVEVASLDSAIGSGSNELLAPYLPKNESERLDPAFAAKLKALNLNIDGATLAENVPGVWSVEGTDRSGKKWEVGLLRSQGQLKMIYAEAAP